MKFCAAFHCYVYAQVTGVHPINCSTVINLQQPGNAYKTMYARHGHFACVFLVSGAHNKKEHLTTMAELGLTALASGESVLWSHLSLFTNQHSG